MAKIYQDDPFGFELQLYGLIGLQHYIDPTPKLNTFDIIKCVGLL